MSQHLYQLITIPGGLKARIIYPRDPNDNEEGCIEVNWEWAQNNPEGSRGHQGAIDRARSTMPRIKSWYFTTTE